MYKPRGYWDIKDNVFKEAINYTSRSEFKKGCRTAYKVALKNGWLEEMDWLKRPVAYNKKWTKEEVFKEARKYKSRSEFQKGCSRAYTIALKSGWLNEMDWLVKGKRPDGYWTKERVFEKAREYKTRSEFMKGCGSAYQVARKNGWLDEMTWFIDGKVKLFTDKNDSVYKYYWEETNSIYIGITLMRRQKERDKEHIFDYKDTVYKYANENGLAVPPMEIIEENITPIEALEREDYWVKYYKERGYNVLNKAKTGVGSGSTGAIAYGKWTKERVFKKASEYKIKYEFKKACISAYDAALRNGWLSEMDWFVEIIKPRGYWNIKENVFEEARKYSTRGDFKKGCKTAYYSAHKNGWIDELFPKKSVA